jgi:hypothetical protein
MSTTNRDAGFWPESKDRDDGCWSGTSGRPGGNCWPEPTGRNGGTGAEGGQGERDGLGLAGLLGKVVAGWTSGSGGRRIRSGS